MVVVVGLCILLQISKIGADQTKILQGYDLGLTGWDFCDHLVLFGYKLRETEAGELAHWVDRLAANVGNLSSTPGT